MDPKENDTVRRGKSVGLGEMVAMLEKRNCRMGSCSRSAITTLDRQALCLNHFLLRCYEKLEGFDPRGASSALNRSTSSPCAPSSKNVRERRSTSACSLKISATFSAD